MGGDMDANPKALTFKFSRLFDAVDFYQRYQINNPPKVAPQASGAGEKSKEKTPAVDAVEVDDLRRQNAAMEAELKGLRKAAKKRKNLQAENAILKRTVAERTSVNSSLENE